ncbi:tetraacyldisaccharide 4'-kinase [Mucilaginibacter sp.]|uniref:tetraacyldisaccharide 4'-kinase n=1 Tax=Mucilaginibacter sp. TaxID=1882438 RepID=UPI0035BBA3D9
MKYLRWLLLPFSILYGLVTGIRNWLYDTGLLKSEAFELPVICVGNLEIGGAGKSPITEYLIRLLKPGNQPATLSRGYGRQTKGYMAATLITTVADIGDEPAQFKHKFPDITVAVCENRAQGIRQLQNDHNLIILDDAFQHRAVRPGFSILLFDYHYLQQPHFVLPAGNLREPFSGRWRADVVVVSKCPPNLTFDEMNRAYYRVDPDPSQPLFFTAIAYQPLQDLQGIRADFTIDADTTIFLLTGIANPAPLVQHLTNLKAHLVHHNYPDHHQFTLKNISKLAADFGACKAQKKIVLTTEKDAQRLGVHYLVNAVANLPVWVLPIGIEFLNNGRQEFDELVLNYVREHTTHNELY